MDRKWGTSLALERGSAAINISPVISYDHKEMQTQSKPDLALKVTKRINK